MDDCIFCKIARGEIGSKIIYENDNFFSIPDANPIVEGHTLIIPKKHFKTLLDMPSTLAGELFDCIKKTVEKIIKNINAGGSVGFNIVNNNFKAAGQVVNHLHFHIIPRRDGDGIKVIA